MTISFEPKPKKNVDLKKVYELTTSRFPKTVAALNASEDEDKMRLPSFTNTTNTGLKVKMPDSVHIFLPGEIIEFIEKDLGTDGAQKELDRRARRHALKSKASVEWKRNKRKK